MKIAHALAALLLLSVPATLVVARAHADGDVKEADATCYTATAILLPGDGSDEALRVDMIRKVLESNRSWTIVTEPPQNRVGEVAIVKFDVKSTYRGGPTVAYTVQCGHGGTCNDVAKEFRAKHPKITPAPVVQCGDVSNVLVNPQVIR